MAVPVVCFKWTTVSFWCGLQANQRSVGSRMGLDNQPLLSVCLCLRSGTPSHCQFHLLHAILYLSALFRLAQSVMCVLRAGMNAV